MYCVRCGVKLAENSAECPLCHTPVMIPDEGGPAVNRYSDLYPEAEKDHGKYLLIGLLTAVMIAVGVACLIHCLKPHGNADWSGYVLMGLGLAWVCLLFPFLFPRFRPMIFLPIDFACLAGFLLYICVKTGGNWFLSFAFPVTGLVALETLAAVALFRYIRAGRLRCLSVLLMLIGAGFMLVELFQHITFGTPMFVWSLYCVCAFGALGLFLLITSFVPPLRAWIRKRFFF